MKKIAPFLFAILTMLLSSFNVSAQMTHLDSVKIDNATVEHRNDSIRTAHKVVIDSIYSGGKYYPVTSTDIYTHNERIKETDLANCLSDSLCKTINVKRKEAEEIEIDFPTNKLSGKLTMYNDLRMTKEIVSGDFPTGEDFIDLEFENIDDGTYLFKLERSDKTYIFKLIVKTTQFWK